MNIFVAGATGRVASFLIGNLVEKGHRVVAGVRDTNRVKPTKNVDVVALDLTDDVDVLVTLLKNIDVIYFTAGSRGKDLLQTDAFGAVKLMQAAEKMGIKRFIMLSSLYATDPSQWELYKNIDHTDYIIAKFFADNYLIHQTNLDYTILQPTTLVEADKATHKVSLGKLESTQNTIPNVARVLSELVDSHSTIGRVIIMSDGNTDVVTAIKQIAKDS